MAVDQNLAGIILAGGGGSRFWPLSTAERPKQFLTIFHEKSLLRLSFERLLPSIAPEKILVLTADRFTDLIREQLPEAPHDNVIGEPLRRDTAAAVALGSLLAVKRWGDVTMTVVTADHLIEPAEEFTRCLESAATGARETGALYTFGIPPTNPTTSYGYLEVGEGEKMEDGVRHFPIESFREKPSERQAAAYLKAGRFFWNSGNFVWTADAIIGEFEAQLPMFLDDLDAAIDADGTEEFKTLLRQGFENLPATSIDYGIMENAEEVFCVRATFDWMDVGGWAVLEKVLQHDSEANAFRGRLMPQGSHGNIVYCEDPEEMVALLGVENLVIVRAGNRTLVMPKERAEDLKMLARRIERES